MSAPAQLFVGSLARDTRPRDLENVFFKHGRLVRCDVKKGYGFVEYEDPKDAEEAIREEHGRRLLGSRIVVEWAKGSIGDKSRSSFRDRDRDRDFDRGGRRRSPPRGRFGDRDRDRSPFNSRFGRDNFRDRRRSISPRRNFRDDRYDRDRFDQGRDRYNDRDRFSRRY